MTSLAWAPTNTLLAAGTGDGTVWLWPVGAGVWELEPGTLKPLRTLPDAYGPANHETARVAGMQVNWAQAPSKVDSSVIYALRWETMPNNQDLPRSPIPAPTPMMWYKLKNPNVTTTLSRSAGKARPVGKSGSRCPLCRYSLSGRKQRALGDPRNE